MQGRERESEESCPDTDLLPLVIAFFFRLSLSLSHFALTSHSRLTFSFPYHAPPLSPTFASHFHLISTFLVPPLTLSPLLLALSLGTQGTCSPLPGRTEKPNSPRRSRALESSLFFFQPACVVYISARTQIVALLPFLSASLRPLFFSSLPPPPLALTTHKASLSLPPVIIGTEAYNCTCDPLLFRVFLLLFFFF